jgi:uncharacterized membrane protein
MHLKYAGSLSSICLVVCWGCVVAQTYTVTDLGQGSGHGINDLGQVVGASSECSSFGTAITFATLWSGGTCSMLRSDAAPSAASAINNAGLAVGYATGGRFIGAVLFPGGNSIVISHADGLALHINESGAVVGASFFPAETGVGRIGISIATMWPAGCVSIDCATQLVGLGYSSRPSGTAYAINNAGQVVGCSTVSNDSGPQFELPTLWNGSTPTALGTVSGYLNGCALGINSSRVIVGYSRTPSSTGQVLYVATRWTGLNATALPLPPGATYSVANAINERGLVVGFSSNGATLWDGTTVIDLNAASMHGAHVTLQDATAINSRGQIVVNGYDSVANSAHVYLLTPTGKSGPSGNLRARSDPGFFTVSATS